MFYEKNEIRFSCTGCGQCCTGDPRKQVIELLDNELETIRDYLGMDIAMFKDKHLYRDTFGSDSIRIGQDHRCTLLDADNRCMVYAVRPLQCQTYPYWPEVMNKRAHWQAEAARCEGIGQGPLIPIATIQLELDRLK